MSTQISRDSYRPGQRYSGVYQQQGRMLVDADLNEFVDVLKARLAQAISDLAGDGSPQAGGIVNLTTPASPQLTFGRAYVAGLTADLVPASWTTVSATPSPADIYNNQADFPGAPPPAAAAPAMTTPATLYLDVWEREITAIEDPYLADPALGGADTSTRTRVMTQLKWCTAPAPGGTAACDDPSKNPRIGDAQLSAVLRQPPPSSGTQIPQPTPPVGNYLFRLEVHDVTGSPTSPSSITLKWSSENGAEQYNFGNQPAGFVTDGYLYELFDDASASQLGVDLTGGGLARGKIYTASALPTSGTYIRRWEGFAQLESDGATPPTWSLATTTPTASDQGVGLTSVTTGTDQGDVVFGSDGTVTLDLSALALKLTLGSAFVAGDYWLIAVRGAGDPGSGQGQLDPASSTPVGVTHNYLTVGTWDGTTLTVDNSSGQWDWGTFSLSLLASEIAGKVNRAGDTMAGALYWGQNGSSLTFDQGGSLDLGGNPNVAGAGAPYINFHYQGQKQAYNAQIVNDGNGQLTINAATTRVLGDLGLTGILGWGTASQLIADGSIELYGGGAGGTGASSIFFNYGGAQAAEEVALTNDAVGQLSVVAPVTRIGNTLQWGNGSLLTPDQGGSIELGASGNLQNAASKTPYIDFHYGTGRVDDFNVRLINNGDRQLSIQGAPNGTLNVEIAGNLGLNGSTSINVNDNGVANLTPLSIQVGGTGTGVHEGIYAYSSGGGSATGAQFTGVTTSNLNTVSATGMTAYGYGGPNGASGTGGSFTANGSAGALVTALSCGVYPPAGVTNNWYALYATGVEAGNSHVLAAFFNGNIFVGGTISKSGSPSFLIDHPLDPDHKTLRHNGVESPENLCLYRGRARLDAGGHATVRLPDYFAALTDEAGATVHLSAIGDKPFPTSYVWTDDHTAMILTGAPDAELSYIVLADRDDPTIHHLRAPVEQQKGGDHFEDGKLLFPAAFDAPAERAVFYEHERALRARHDTSDQS